MKIIPLQFKKPLLIFAFLIIHYQLSITNCSAQYFGRNKIVYKNFDFRVLRTEHFQIHHYFRDSLIIRDAARMSERWYDRLSTATHHKFKELKPLIFYANQ